MKPPCLLAPYGEGSRGDPARRTPALAAATRVPPALPTRPSPGLHGGVAVVAGYQGGAAHDRISTLGRGGSDTSAVAVAAGLRADRCDIYTDVDGVYTTDPRIVPKARRLEKVAYEEMLEMASLGIGRAHG